MIDPTGAAVGLNISLAGVSRAGNANLNRKYRQIKLDSLRVSLMMALKGTKNNSLLEEHLCERKVFCYGLALVFFSVF